MIETATALVRSLNRKTGRRFRSRQEINGHIAIEEHVGSFWYFRAYWREESNSPALQKLREMAAADV